MARGGNEAAADEVIERGRRKFIVGPNIHH